MQQVFLQCHRKLKKSEWMFLLWLSLLPGVMASTGIDKICIRVHVATRGVGKKWIVGIKTTQISTWSKNTKEVLGVGVVEDLCSFAVPGR